MAIVEIKETREVTHTFFLEEVEKQLGKPYAESTDDERIDACVVLMSEISLTSDEGIDVEVDIFEE